MILEPTPYRDYFYRVAIRVHRAPRLYAKATTTGSKTNQQLWVSNPIGKCLGAPKVASYWLLTESKPNRWPEPRLIDS